MNKNKTKFQIINKEALSFLKSLDDDSIDSIITSPPYFNLRDYGNKKQIGLEKSSEEYIINLYNIFIEAYRVLKPSGTLFINIGDVYKNKELLQIPSRLAILLAKKFTLRNKIIWHKPNSMPESVKNRFTVDYEEVLFFVKNKNKYFFNQQLEKAIWSDDKRLGLGRLHYKGKKRKGKNGTGQENFVSIKEYRNLRSVWKIPTTKFYDSHFAVFPEKLIEPMIKAGSPENALILDIFSGSGTTGVVALKNNRRFIGVDINKDYCKMAEKRLNALCI